MADKKDDDSGFVSLKPVDNSFQQQRLKAWQPLLTPKYVIGTFSIAGVLFLVIGIIALLSSNAVVELSVRYDNLPCNFGSTGVNCTKTVSLEVTDDMDPPVFFYYELSNFYQNHRRYVKSRSDKQLKGDNGGTSYCDPRETVDDVNLYPCGLIADSMFNDSYTPTVDGKDLEWTNYQITWDTDRNEKFKRREVEDGETGVGTGGFTIWTEENNEDFVVWMRTAGLPTFKKLHRKIHTKLNKGETISVDIEDVFPVDDFDGEKAIVFSTTCWLGGKNPFLGYAYIIVGVICLHVSAIFSIKQCKCPRKLGEIYYYDNKRGKNQPLASQQQ